ncbi:MAG: prepilin-type N-terminal cleavage/methylation domain-containing protein [Terriglobales bacterium]
MRKTKGFSLIELLIVVAIILIIAAIAAPSFLHARMAANESATVGTLRTLNSAQVTYNSTYPTIGFASALTNLAGTTCASVSPTSASACLIDSALGGGTKSGYLFVLSGVSGTPATTYQFVATPVGVNQTGINYFCSFADAVVRSSSAAISTCDGSVVPQQ